MSKQKSELPASAVVLTPELCLSIGNEAARFTPREGLELAERLTRASFRRMLCEEAAALETITQSEER